jgi:hypothetical protein
VSGNRLGPEEEAILLKAAGRFMNQSVAF